MALFLRKVDLKKLIISEDIKSRKDNVSVKEGVKDVENAKVFFREAFPQEDQEQSSITLLLLHGMRFSSKTWLDLGTIQLLAAFGYRTLAVDLPGYANSPAAEIPDKAAFLKSLIEAFGLKCPVIVSPSMGGYYTLPYLIKHWKNLVGYVPVAPVGFEVLEALPSSKDLSCKDQVYQQLREFLPDTIPDLSKIKTPTMVVFGQKDRSRSSALLNLLPNSQAAEIPDAGHPAYLDNPDLWHQLLYNFLHSLKTSFLKV